MGRGLFHCFWASHRSLWEQNTRLDGSLACSSRLFLCSVEAGEKESMIWRHTMKQLCLDSADLGLASAWMANCLGTLEQGWGTFFHPRANFPSREHLRCNISAVEKWLQILPLYRRLIGAGSSWTKALKENVNKDWLGCYWGGENPKGQIESPRGSHLAPWPEVPYLWHWVLWKKCKISIYFI